jgi:hypothetical protein
MVVPAALDTFLHHECTWSRKHLGSCSRYFIYTEESEPQEKIGRGLDGEYHRKGTIAHIALLESRMLAIGVGVSLGLLC